jgi:hypothetical protein
MRVLGLSAQFSWSVIAFRREGIFVGKKKKLAGCVVWKIKITFFTRDPLAV